MNELHDVKDTKAYNRFVDKEKMNPNFYDVSSLVGIVIHCATM